MYTCTRYCFPPMLGYKLHRGCQWKSVFSWIRGYVPPDSAPGNYSGYAPPPPDPRLEVAKRLWMKSFSSWIRAYVAPDSLLGNLLPYYIAPDRSWWRRAGEASDGLVCRFVDSFVHDFPFINSETGSFVTYITCCTIFFMVYMRFSRHRIYPVLFPVWSMASPLCMYVAPPTYE